MVIGQLRNFVSEQEELGDAAETMAERHISDLSIGKSRTGLGAQQARGLNRCAGFR